ncbi:nucleotidyltransferase domain-containing protein [Streptomyces sp. NBC_01465]|uniref:nucleotidyltransferase domain-containing protein n=1 Tax=Streptomyces sp. NBC_01465 TaxID=2903878 RepID=UPI003FCE2574
MPLGARRVHFVMARAEGQEIDPHPLAFAPDSSAVQQSFDPGSPFPYPAECLRISDRISAAGSRTARPERKFSSPGPHPRRSGRRCCLPRSRPGPAARHCQRPAGP